MLEARQSHESSTATKLAFQTAAEKMDHCASLSNEDHSVNTLWFHAATCYEAAMDVPRASRSYRRGGFYDRAVLVSFDSQNFDDCLLTLLPYADKLDPPTHEKIKDVSRMYYLRNSDYLQVIFSTYVKSADVYSYSCSKLRQLFDDSLDKCVDYAQSNGFNAQHKDLLSMSNRFEDLAKVHLKEGSPADAVHYLLLAPQISTSRRVETIASAYLWANLGLNSTPSAKVTNQASKLLRLLARSKDTPSEPMAQDVSTRVERYYTKLTTIDCLAEAF